ncbi:RICIN domain-containing protein [Chitinophaga pinensis]|uniref:Ricin B lectin n=1 Tax=Chitinophaga pinensis (strain ATCC 43595 / DSM 2588 / LMG 13176 / NBRC 15968 / NCIMB 11800 / UQM 2034) TaxID=485918 RepID=A0A979G7S2_CHIPD|nr:RICIN domain-containing protein [Chitinophaga pinensis]ACU62262.1 Ricin B lectin [Chitinophaga pinensis DSM 2588]
MKKSPALLVMSLLTFMACKQGLLTPVEKPQNADNTVGISQAITADYITVSIKNVKSSKFLEVAGNPVQNAKFKDNALLQQWETSLSGTETNRWQKWHLIYQTTVNGTRYYHIRNLHSGKLIDVPSASGTSGTVLQQYAAFPLLADQQLWSLTDIGGGQYRIVNKGNSLSLSVAGGSTSNGAQVIQETTASDNKQYWTITEITPDTYRDDQVVRFFNRNSASLGSAAFDQGNTIPLTWGANNGKVLWVTQDAWDGSQVQSNGMFNCGHFFSYNNSIFIQPSKTDWTPNNAPNMTIPNSTSGKPKQICNIQSGTTWSWPGPGVEIGDKVYMQCGEGNGLNATNQSLYRLTQSATTQWTAERLMPNGFNNYTAISYSTGLVKPGDGYVYAFGSEATSFGYGSYIHVARFAENNPLQWQYWSGSAWTSSPAAGAASKIADARGSNSVAYLNGKYILMTLDQGFNCDPDRSVYIATSTSPTGPFTAQIKVYTILEYFKEQYTRYYTPVIHPEFNNGRNELLLTYSVNFSACGLDGCEGAWLDPYYYRLKGIRVPYSKIGL